MSIKLLQYFWIPIRVCAETNVTEVEGQALWTLCNRCQVLENNSLRVYLLIDIFYKEVINFNKQR